MVLVSHVISQEHMTKGCVNIMGRNLLWQVKFAKFDVHRHFGSGNITVLDCHVISKDHVIKVSSHFMGKSTSR